MKIENSHVFDADWLYRMSRMPSLRLMSLNLMMSLHITIMQTSAVEVTASLKIHVQK